MDLGVRGAAAVVTGGTKGMGRSTAEFLARDGARVAVFARGRETLDEAVHALRALGSPDPVGLSVDVGDEGSVSRAFAELGSRWGSLNILVNTVGPGMTGTIAGGVATTAARAAATTAGIAVIRSACWPRA